MKNKKGKKVTKKEEERKKRVVMWVGISLIMSLILVGWIFSIKSVFNQSKSISFDSDQSEWNEVRDELTQALSRAKEDMEQLKSNSTVAEIKDELQIVDKNNQEEIITQPLPEARDRVNIFSEDKILELKDKLE